MTLSTFVAIVRECAETSIRSTLSTLSKFAASYRSRTTALRTRLVTCEATLATVPAKTTSTSMAVSYLLLAINAQRVSIELAERFLRTHTTDLAQRLSTLPDVLIAAYQGFSVPPSTALTAATVCPRVETALRPYLTAVIGDLSTVKLSLDERLQKIEQNMFEIERGVTELRSALLKT